MSTASRPSKPSTTSSAPTPPLHPSATTTVDASAQLVGSNPLYLGPLTTLHPRARIVTTYATVRIGEGSVICERAVLGREKARGGESEGQVNGQSEGNGTEEEIIIGDYVLIEPGAVVEAASIGEGSTIGVGCVLGDRCIIGENVTLLPQVTVPPNTSVPDFTVVYRIGGVQHQRIDHGAQQKGILEARKKLRRRQAEVLRLLIKGR